MYRYRKIEFYFINIYFGIGKNSIMLFLLFIFLFLIGKKKIWIKFDYYFVYLRRIIFMIK